MLLASSPLAWAAPPDAGVVQIDTDRAHILNTFDPDRALGTSLDVQPRGLIDKVFEPSMIKQMLSAGWGPISYRNNTELRISAWHWNENGTWSDQAHKSGYFTGSSEPKESIRYIESYSLPHRGFSRSGGGASSLLDSADRTYWKSNPYLTRRFTGESDALHPQWVVLDLGAPAEISAVQIDWVQPFARTYDVEYWIGEDAMRKQSAGEWKAFPAGKFSESRGGSVVLKLTPSPITARYLRIWMTESSNTCDLHGAEDLRNCVGYAISDIRAGNLNEQGSFIEAVEQSGRRAIYTSSVDPWHSANDVAEHGGQHTGFDLFFTGGITNRLPAMIPVTMLYGTPDDSAAQIAYIKKRGYPIGWIEMGEEPDGKHLLPEDYGAFYLQWATAIHKVDPSLKLGGPVFEGMNEDLKVWPDAQGKTSWLGRFLDYLKSHGRLSDLAFVSFEHYPFAPCGITWTDLYKEPQLMSHILDVWREDGVPTDVPLMVTESNISWNLSGPMSQIFSALWLSDSIGSFLKAGGAAYYHSPIQPQPVGPTCIGSASWATFLPDENYKVKSYTAFYFAARLLNFEWVKHGSGRHELFPASSDLRDADGNVLVTAYAVHRPDDQWAILLVNRDQEKAHSVRVVFGGEGDSKGRRFVGRVKLTSFGSEQYVWRENGAASHPDPDGPPVSRMIAAGPDAAFTLPKASVSVLRGKLGAAE